MIYLDLPPKPAIIRPIEHKLLSPNYLPADPIVRRAILKEMVRAKVITKREAQHAMLFCPVAFLKSAGGGGGGFDLTEVDNVVDGTQKIGSASGSYTISVSTGTADVDRFIIVGWCIVYSSATFVQFPSAEINSFPATSLVNASPTNMRCGLNIEPVVTGTSTNVVISWLTSGSFIIERIGVIVWRMVAPDGEAAFAASSDSSFSGNALSASLQIPTGGGGVGYACGNNATAPRTWAWTNMTEGTDETIEANTSQSGALSTVAGTLTRTATASDSQTAGALLLASWSPAA